MGKLRSDVVEKQKEIDAMPDGEKKDAMQGNIDVTKEAYELKEKYAKGKNEPICHNNYSTNK